MPSMINHPKLRCHLSIRRHERAMPILRSSASTPVLTLFLLASIGFLRAQPISCTFTKVNKQRIAVVHRHLEPLIRLIQEWSGNSAQQGNEDQSRRGRFSVSNRMMALNKIDVEQEGKKDNFSLKPKRRRIGGGGGWVF